MTDSTPDWADLAAKSVCRDLPNYFPINDHSSQAEIVIAQAIRDQPGRPPDYCYEGDSYVAWPERDVIVESYPIGEIVEVETEMDGPNKYGVCVVVTTDGDGDPDKTEIRWFDSEKAAQEAVDAKPVEGE